MVAGYQGRLRPSFVPGYTERYAVSNDGSDGLIRKMAREGGAALPLHSLCRNATHNSGSGATYSCGTVTYHSGSYI